MYCDLDVVMVQFFECYDCLALKKGCVELECELVLLMRVLCRKGLSFFLYALERLACLLVVKSALNGVFFADDKVIADDRINNRRFFFGSCDMVSRLCVSDCRSDFRNGNRLCLVGRVLVLGLQDFLCCRCVSVNLCDCLVK